MLHVATRTRSSESELPRRKQACCNGKHHRNLLLASLRSGTRLMVVDGEVDQREGGDVGDSDELGGVAGLEVMRVKNHGRHGGGDGKGHQTSW